MTIRQHTILIIDDCIEDRKLYCRYLNQSIITDYQIIEVDSGEDGLTQLTSIVPDLILLDYLLPDLNGLEFIAELKTQTDNIPPIIMLTGQGNEAIAVEAMKSGVKDYLTKDKLTPEILMTSANSVIQQHHWQVLLTKAIQQQQLIAATALRIRRSLDLAEILSVAVQEVQLLLNCDRVVIYKFAPDMSGEVVAESVNYPWSTSLGTKIIDTCFQQQGVARYQKGEIVTTSNIYKSQLSACHIESLEKFQVKSNAVVPILLSSSPPNSASYCLWGLLIAHQCKDFRQWKPDEIELLDKLSVQLAIAIQQAELLENLQSELKTRKQLELQLERLVQIVAASEDYIGLADLKGQFIWQNPRLKKVIGLCETTETEEKLLSFADFLPT